MEPSALINRKLACLAGRLHISARAATSDMMNDFIVSIIDVTLQSIPHSDHRDSSKIFRPMSDKKLANELVVGANIGVNAALKRLNSCAITLQIDAGTILRNHFLNYVVAFPGQIPFLIRSEFRDKLDQFAYADITRDVILELENKEVVVAAVVADNLFAQQSGLRMLVNDPKLRPIIICPCANHTLNLVLQCEIKENPTFQSHIGILKRFQHIMRSRYARRNYGLTCPDYPETRWIYIAGVLRWICDEEQLLIPWLCQCVEDGNNEIGHDLRTNLSNTGFDVGQIPEWIYQLYSVIKVLESLSDRFECRDCALWMIVPLVEQAKCELLSKSEGEGAEWIQELSRNLTVKLVARFRATFNYEAAIAAYLLSSTGRVKYANEDFAGIPKDVPARPQRVENPVSVRSRSKLNKDHFDAIETTEEELSKLVLFDDEDNDAIIGRHFVTGSETDVDNQIGESHGKRNYRQEVNHLQNSSTALNDPVFENMMYITLKFLNEFSRKFENQVQMQTFEVESHFIKWMRGGLCSWNIPDTEPPEVMWAIISTDEEWRKFANLAIRLVAIIPSESEVERTISLQRSITGMKGTQFGQRVFTARTQIHQLGPDISIQ
jgi:hypothetical protein